LSTGAGAELGQTVKTLISHRHHGTAGTSTRFLRVSSSISAAGARPLPVADHLPCPDGNDGGGNHSLDIGRFDREYPAMFLSDHDRYAEMFNNVRERGLGSGLPNSAF
jgi:hypothetical protein